MEDSRKILICGLGSIGSYYVKLILKKWPDCRISILRSGFGIPKKEELLVENIKVNLLIFLNPNYIQKKTHLLYSKMYSILHTIQY